MPSLTGRHFFMIVNIEAIIEEIRSYSDDEPYLKSLMVAALLRPLKENKKLQHQITDTHQFSSKTLRKKFNRATSPWFKIELDSDAFETINRCHVWLKESFPKNGFICDGAIKDFATERLKQITTLDELLERIEEGQLISQEEYNELFNQRIRPMEERKGHLAHITTIRRFNLFQIMDVTGIKAMGKKSNNCLGYNNLPNGLIPHKKRVLESDKWLYFTLQNPDNWPIATILIHCQTGSIKVEGNEGKTVDEKYDHLVFNAIDQIEKIYPHAANNYQNLSNRYYTWRKYRDWENETEHGPKPKKYNHP